MELQNFIKSCDVDTSNIPKILEQYLSLKRQNAESIVFFRLGDFYETYFEDAYVLSKVCGVLLTKRKFLGVGDILMAGVPHNNAEIYIAKLTKEKYKVSIAEQVQSKDEVKKGNIIKREIIRTYSPGTLIDESFLDSKENNFIASILKSGDRYGFSYADISTGEFFITEGNLDEILCELSKVSPTELLLKIKTREIEPMKTIPEAEPDMDEIIPKKYPYTLVKADFYDFNPENINDKGLLEYKIGLKCANSIINYAKTTQKNFMPKLDIIKKYSISTRLIMNQKTRENLELNKTFGRISGEGKKYGSILWSMDRCKTVMGKRLLAHWLNEPLYNKSEIEKRLNGVEELVLNKEKLEKLSSILENLSDISRLSSKLSNGTITPKELLAIKNTLEITEAFSKCCSGFKAEILKPAAVDENLVNFREIIEKTIKEEPSNNIRVGNIIKEGANGVLDTVRAELAGFEGEIISYEKELIKKTGVKNLKINYTKNLGYSIEVPVSGVKEFTIAVEGCFVKQKLSGCERFGTEVLNTLEERILRLKLKSYELEFDTYLKLREYAKELTEPIRQFAYDVSLKDVLVSFALIAIENNYTKPKFTDEFLYEVKEGVHPVLERLCTSDNTQYDRLDISFSENVCSKILTGANMSGKSTYLREVAALIILAQAGSFVPAKSFRANLVDKIFARMGSGDDLLNSNSAFMCEMLDITEILRNSTPKSLILLDETGNSTSYSDGIAISYGIIKYITGKIKAKTLLATHFHRLSVLENDVSGCRNFRLVFDENGKKPVRCLKEGVSTSSLGFNAAIKAGLPDEVITCAKNFQQKCN